MNRLFLLLLSLTIAPLAALQAQTARPMRLLTADDVGIAGTFYPVPATNAPAILLLHGFSQTRDEWAGFAPLLQRNGFAVLAIDLRGHGASTRRIGPLGPQLIDLHNFTARDYPAMMLDVNAAIDWLAEQPGLDRKRLAILGAGAGANLGLRYAALNEDVVALVLLSPGINYRGLRTDNVINQLGNRPLRLIVSQQDTIAYESSKRLVELRHQNGHGSPKDLVVCTGNLFGTELLQQVKELPLHIVPWLRHWLLGEPLPELAPTPTAPNP